MQKTGKHDPAEELYPKNPTIPYKLWVSLNIFTSRLSVSPTSIAKYTTIPKNSIEKSILKHFGALLLELTQQHKQKLIPVKYTLVVLSIYLSKNSSFGSVKSYATITILHTMQYIDNTEASSKKYTKFRQFLIPTQFPMKKQW